MLAYLTFTMFMWLYGIEPDKEVVYTACTMSVLTFPFELMGIGFLVKGIIENLKKEQK